MNQIKNNEDSLERKKRYKALSSAERKRLNKKKIKIQVLTEGSGVSGKDQSSYDNEEIINLIFLTRCFQKNKVE